MIIKREEAMIKKEKLDMTLRDMKKREKKKKERKRERDKEGE